MASALKDTFKRQLLQAFDSGRVVIGPIKKFSRCQTKIASYPSNCARPHAAFICDYLRGAVLCNTIHETVDILSRLGEEFTVVRVISRMAPSVKGFRVILVHVVVKDSGVRPHKYGWSGWWDKQDVAIIAEVKLCLCVYYLCSCLFIFEYHNQPL